MTERLDRIEALVGRNAEGIDTLLGAVSTIEVSNREQAARVDTLVAKIDESNRRFETLRLEAQNDRDEYRALFNDAIAEMRQQQSAWQSRFDAQQAVIERLLLAILDRDHAQERLLARITRLEQQAR